MTSPPSTPEDLAADLAACEAATAGPWDSVQVYGSDGAAVLVFRKDPAFALFVPVFDDLGHADEANADFCSHARNRFPQVVRELIEARAEIAERESQAMTVVGACARCLTSIYADQPRATDQDGREYHAICIVTKRAEAAEAEVERLRAMVPVCRFCGKEAICYGKYEGEAGCACDDCCGHGCEGGWCERLRKDGAE